MALLPRIVIGPRANGNVGMFISPPGVNADTAADSALTLSLTSKVSQLLMLGHVPAGVTLGIVLGVSQRPYVLLTSRFNFAGVPGHTTGDGPLRPSPPPVVSPAYADIDPSGASMNISSPNVCVYAVYSSPF